MGTERWEQVKEQFECIVQLSTGARAEALARLKQSDPELFVEVEELVSNDEQAGDFFLAETLIIQQGPRFKIDELIAGRYKIVRFIGRGGMGEVYEAHDHELGERLALKTILSDAVPDRRYVARLLQEVKLARKVANKHVCRVHDIGCHDAPWGRTYFFTMEFLEGGTLAERLHRRHTMSAEEAFPLIEQMAEALDAAHAENIIHRDFKPGNIMLVPQAAGTRVVVTDFGLARSGDATQSFHTRVEGANPPGTMGYIAPELFRPGAVATIASDIYSFGVVIREMVAGDRTIATSSAPASPSSLDAHWKRTIRRCLDTDAERRFKSARDVVDALRPEPRRVRLVLGGIITGALILGVASAIWLRPHPEIGNEPLIAQPLTAAQGWEGFPSFSPDGSQVTYAWDERANGDNSHIYVKMIGSGRPMQLTSDAQPDFVPAWSPDGRTIAFGRLLDPIRDAGHHGSIRHFDAIHLIPPLGGSERELEQGHFQGTLSWSSDSKYLAIAGQESPAEPYSLYLIAPESGEKLRLTTPPDVKIFDQDPSFSPDGRALLFTRCRVPFACGLYVLELSPGYRPLAEPRLLKKEENGAIFGAAWTPDGKGVVYGLSKDADFNPTLVRMRVPPVGTPERLPYAGERAFGPTIARFGNRLAYTQDFYDLDIWQIQPGQLPRTFLSSTRLDVVGEYSPDGKHVAFASNRSGQMNIWLCDERGENLVQLTHFEEHTASPRWSPDGHWIVFDRHLKTGWHIFVMASDGGQVRKLTSDDGNEVVPSWSRDGNWIYYADNRTGRFEIWKVPATGGSRNQVTRNGGSVAIESHDGRSLYYTKNLENSDTFSGLWVSPVAGGEERLVLKSVWNRAFAVMDDGIYYVPAPTKDGSTSVRFHDFASRQDHEIASIKQGFDRRFTVSPDRKTFLFSATARTGSNVMVVENFR